MCSEIFFFQHFVDKIQQKHFFMYQQWTAKVHLFLKVSNYRFFVFFKTYFKKCCFDTNISNCLKIDFLEFFPYWFYIFNRYKFIFQRFTWKMISTYFYDLITLKEWTTTKNLSVSTYYWHKWLVHLNFPMFTTAMCYTGAIFSGRILNMCKLRTKFYLIWRTSLPEVGQSAYRAGQRWQKQADLVSMRSEIFLQIKFIIFPGCPTKRAARLPGQSTP